MFNCVTSVNNIPGSGLKNISVGSVREQLPNSAIWINDIGSNPAATNLFCVMNTTTKIIGWDYVHKCLYVS